MDLGIDRKVALVVGGSKGIGLSVARMLAAEGSRVAVVARTQSDIDLAVKGTCCRGTRHLCQQPASTRPGVAQPRGGDRARCAADLCRPAVPVLLGAVEAAAVPGA